jgi:hypothetical protein
LPGPETCVMSKRAAAKAAERRERLPRRQAVVRRERPVGGREDPPLRWSGRYDTNCFPRFLDEKDAGRRPIIRVDETKG